MAGEEDENFLEEDEVETVDKGLDDLTQAFDSGDLNADTVQQYGVQLSDEHTEG